MQTSNQKLSFHWISSYRGSHDYGVYLADGSHHRLRVRVAPDRHDQYCTLGPTEWELEVNGAQGFVTCLTPALLTEDLVAAFNRYKYSEWRHCYDTILANPERYGPYAGGLCSVVGGAKFNRESRRWEPLHEFEAIRAKAGIPAEFCVDARAALRATLALVA